MMFKGTSEPVASIARELGVDAVVTGSVLWVGDRVKITAYLINASADATVWAESFESDGKDIISLQRRVAREVARGIEIELTPLEDAAYLRGRFLWNERNTQSVPRSIELFEEALRIEPDFADAWAGLAEAYTILASYSQVSARETLPRARDCAARATEIDSTLAAAWNVLAEVAYVYDLDWTKCEQYRGAGIDPRATLRRGN
jgi:tetratricopeptide (TPR) repeat protein